MLKRLTIRHRILVTFIAIVLIGSILQLIIAGRQLQLATLEFYQHHQETEALMVAATLSESMEHYQEGAGTQEIQRVLDNLRQQPGHDYLIVDRNYQIVGYIGNKSYTTMSRVTVTPELAEAGRGRIGADVRKDPSGEKWLFVAVSIQYAEYPQGYLILAQSMQPAYTDIYHQWLQLGSTTLPVIALVVVAGLWLSGTISRPVQQLRNAALRMAEGALDTRNYSDAQDEVGELSHAFNYMAEQIEGLMKTQRNFVSNAAHELRTPLMTLKLRIEALEDDTLPATERAVYLTELNQEIDHMAELVSSLLVLARIDEGRDSHNSNLIDITSVLKDVARHWRIEAEKAGLDFEMAIPADVPDLPLTVNDLRLVLDNLLGNAMKYTPQGRVVFSVRQIDRHVAINVCDTGVGFSPQQAEHLFTRFYRSEEARAHFEGNGLGLSIVQGILEQYGASIRGESAGIGQGATFVVQIPLETKATPLSV